MINIIAAVGKNRELGFRNALIWHLKDDMKYFKETTLYHTVVMGRKTYESIGKALPNRRNIVITHLEMDDAEVMSIDDVLSLSKSEEVFVIGGETIYREFLSYADKLYLTEIDDEHEADAFFPEFDKSNYDKKIIKEDMENGIKYSFVKYTHKI